jgi:nitroimidazol reductase NimA-like FMN-containing flavoprotein (pyridoxamine 5'-phosphate oxidase superfamily)
MLGTLTENQCEHVLRSELVGRIGCYAAGKVYVVPVAYVFHKNYIYAHSKEGMKIRMMRKNAKVCFEVESRESLNRWRTVILWGTYEELKSAPEQKEVMKILNDRFIAFTISDTVLPTSYKNSPRQVEKARKPVFFRISIDEITGRFEK